MSNTTDKAEELLRGPDNPQGPFHCPGCGSVHLAVSWDIEGSLTIIYTEDGKGEINEVWDDDPDVHPTYPFSVDCLDCEKTFEFEEDPGYWRELKQGEL